MTPAKPNQELTEYKLQSMNEKIDSLDQAQKEGFRYLGEKIDSMSMRFATREDHKENKDKISSIESSISGINLKIALATGGFSVLLFIIEKVWK